MIDVVTVVFDEELPILKCQAQSIDLYCQHLGIRNIYVMVNQIQPIEIDRSWWGSMGHLVRVIARAAYDEPWSGNGWLDQQLLKIYGARQSNNVWSMILDAKTVLTNTITNDLLINKNGQARFDCVPISPVFHPARDISNAVFGTDNDQILMPAGVPFLFHNESIRGMITHVENSTNRAFGRWFLDQGMVTEFVLYSTWILGYPNHQKLYADSDHCSLNICHCCHVQGDRFDEILDSHDDHSHTLSVHRKVWQGLSSEQKQRFRSRLIACGITTAEHLV